MYTIKAIKEIKAPDIIQYSWQNLRRFHNVSFLTQKLMSKHNVPKEQKDNATKQAQQIRYCLLQAKEYFDASRTVSLATKPTLLYYSIMSMALAEILFKQDGRSSLDKARKTNQHHGLNFSFSTSNTDSLEELSSALKARPHRTGTFRLWHKTAREMPIIGEENIHQDNGVYTTCTKLQLSASLEPFPDIPVSGISLLDCLQLLPYIDDYPLTKQKLSKLVRTSIKTTVFYNANPQIYKSELAIITHPDGRKEKVESFINNITAHPELINYCDIYEANHNSYVMKFPQQWINGSMVQGTSMQFPAGISTSKEETFFYSENVPLNEFGIYYIGLYISGMYARYYPDQWIQDIEKSNTLALAIEHLIESAYERIPLLILSELDQTLYLQK